MRISSIYVAIGAAGFLGAGGLAAAAVSQSSAPQPTKTVTVNVGTGPVGPPGPAGPSGPAGNFECIMGYSPGILVINHPGGQTKVYTCLEGQ